MVSLMLPYCPSVQNCTDSGRDFCLVAVIQLNEYLRSPGLFAGLCVRGRATMSKAIEQIVDAYVRLNNRRALEDLKMHRQRLAVDLKSRTGFDFSLPIGQVDEEIAIIEAGLERLKSIDSGA
jgi:hypothetical protein